MKAGEFLKKQKDVILPLIVGEDEEIDKVLQRLLKHRAYEIIYVHDSNGKLSGYIHSSSLIKHYASEHIIASGGNIFASEIFHYMTSQKAGDIMKNHILYCHEDENLRDIFINMMKEKHPYIIAVLNSSEEHVGFIDLLDMTEEIIRENGGDEA